MSLPIPTFAGQEATVAGKTYEAVSVNPPVWKGVTTGTHGTRLQRLEGFQTVADMRAKVEFKDSGYKVEWRGYYAESDGGSNWGIVKTGDSTSLVDDGFSLLIIVNNSTSGVWVEANISQSKISILKAGAKNGVDSTNAIKNIIAAGKSPLIPLGLEFIVSDEIRLADNIGISGRGTLKFNYVDSSRDYIQIKSESSYVKDITIDGSLTTTDTSVSAAIAMRLGSKLCKVSGVKIINVPASGIVDEQGNMNTIDNVYLYRCRRHGIYLTASENPTVKNYKIIENKLEAFVIRGKQDLSPLSPQYIAKGLISGYHPDTTRWNAITLAQHPNQGTGTYYNYVNIHINKLTVKNPFNGAGYGAPFYNNGEPFSNCTFKNITHYGGGDGIAFDFRDGNDCSATDLISYDSPNTAFNIQNCNNFSLYNARAINSVTTGNPNSSVFSYVNSKNITNKSSVIRSNNGNYGHNAVSNSRVSLSSDTITAGVLNGIKRDSSSFIKFGELDSEYQASSDNLQGSLNALLIGSGSRTYNIPSDATIVKIVASISQAITSGTLTVQVRVNGSVRKTLTLTSSSGVLRVDDIEPLTVNVEKDDALTVVIYTTSDFLPTTTDLTVQVLLSNRGGL